MGENTLVGKIAGLLRDPATEKQIAAAIVLGELRARDAKTIAGLLTLLDSGLPPLQRHALNALGVIGTTKALAPALALLSSRDESVRNAAAQTIAAFGEDAVPAVKQRLADVTTPAEKRALEEVLGRLGSKDALSALFASMDPQDLDAAGRAAFPMRAHIKQSTPKEQRRTLDQVLAFLAGKKSAASPAVRLVATKILGFVADEKAIPALLRLATARTEREPIRQEAIIAVRLATTGAGLPAALSGKLLALAESAPLGVARAGLYSLAGVRLSSTTIRRLAKLAAHVETERARLAIDLLGQTQDSGAAKAIGNILATTKDRVRAEAAAGALAKQPRAGEALARALLTVADHDRAAMLASLLRPHLATLDAKWRRQIGEAAMERLADGDPCSDSFLNVARASDAAGTASRLRVLCEKLRKAKKFPRALAVLRILGRSTEAAPEDGYALASMELVHGGKDQALSIFQQLLDRGFDVAAAIRKDRTLTMEHRYQVGFHFAEGHHPLGEDLLSAVGAAAGRTKIGHMARAKLKSSGL